MSFAFYVLLWQHDNIITNVIGTVSGKKNKIIIIISM